MWAQAWQRQRPPTLLGSAAADLPCPKSSRAVSLLPLTVFLFLLRLCNVNGLYPEESRLHCYGLARLYYVSRCNGLID
ncbi:hypothetical protein VPH35_139099 [Triticum aestivum]